MEGIRIGIDVGAKYDKTREWFSEPNNFNIPNNSGGVFHDSTTRKEPPIYARKFSSPAINSSKSYYLYFEGNEPFDIRGVQFLDYYDRTSS